jgi:hypothetical protein
MKEVRAYHTATVLQNGEVLVAGGATGPTVSLASAELYRPADDIWSAADTMATPRWKHTATLLPSGSVLVTGGSSMMETAMETAELYDPVADTWSPAGSMAQGRYSHTATLLMDGKVLVVGGLNDGVSTSSVELYDPKENTWATPDSMSVPRAYHVAARLADGSVLVAGGAAPEHLDSAEIYNPDTKMWSVVASMGAQRSSATATALAGCDALECKVLVAGSYKEGSDTAETYDAVTDKWSLAGLMSTSRYSHVATLLNNGKVLVAGGANEGSNLLSSAEVFDPATRTWASAGSMTTARYLPALASLPDGRVLITGGGAPLLGDYLRSADLYTPPPAPVGALCNVSSQCQSTLCVEGTCHCVSRNDCPTELACDMAGGCAAPFPLGAECASFDQCLSGFCSEGRCGKLGGEVCNGPDECRSGSCGEGVCACASVHDCASGLVCDLSLRCSPRPLPSDGGCAYESLPPLRGRPGWGVGLLLLAAGARAFGRRRLRGGQP